MMATQTAARVQTEAAILFVRNMVCHPSNAMLGIMRFENLIYEPGFDYLSLVLGGVVADKQGGFRGIATSVTITLAGAWSLSRLIIFATGCNHLQLPIRTANDLILGTKRSPKLGPRFRFVGVSSWT